MQINTKSIVEEDKKPVVIMFKRQRKGVLDLWLLKKSLKQWSRLYKNIDGLYICGIYPENELNLMLDYLTADFIKKYKITIINISEIPKIYDTNKVNRANFQHIMAYKALKRGFVVGYNDMFPIKPIDDTYLNKEYRILHKDYRKMKPEDHYWWADFYIKTSEWFKEHYNLENYIMYKGHNPQYYNKEFMEFYLEHPELHIDMNRDTILLHWNLVKGYNILRDNFMLNTYFSDKWLPTKSDTKTKKMVDVAVPESKKTINLLKKLLLK